MQNAARFTHHGSVGLLCRVEEAGEESQRKEPRFSSPATADGTASTAHPTAGKAQSVAVTAVTPPRLPAGTSTGSSPDGPDAGGAGCSGQGVLRVTFAVEDSGSGLSEEVRETLYSLYKSQGGLGLGLFLTHQLISCLGSHLHVESPWAADGSAGTAFRFSVDMARGGAAVDSSPWTSAEAEAEGGALGSMPPQPQATPTPTPKPLPQFAPNLHVLIADDQPTNRRLLRRAFTSFFGPSPWDVSEASTAEQAHTNPDPNSDPQLRPQP